jgi:hypothetical protein
VPRIAVAHGVIVAPYPHIAGPGTARLNPHNTRPRGRADSYSDGKLSEHGSGCQQHQYKNLDFHDFDSLSLDCVVNAEYRKHVAGPRYVEYLMPPSLRLSW